MDDETQTPKKLEVLVLGSGLNDERVNFYEENLPNINTTIVQYGDVADGELETHLKNPGDKYEVICLVNYDDRYRKKISGAGDTSQPGAYEPVANYEELTLEDRSILRSIYLAVRAKELDCLYKLDAMPGNIEDIPIDDIPYEQVPIAVISFMSTKLSSILEQKFHITPLWHFNDVGITQDTALQHYGNLGDAAILWKSKRVTMLKKILPAKEKYAAGTLKRKKEIETAYDAVISPK